MLARRVANDLSPLHRSRISSIRPIAPMCFSRSSLGSFLQNGKSSVPRIGETSYRQGIRLDDGLEMLRRRPGPHPTVESIMTLKEKLQMLMARNSLNGQKLARLSQVSDSEISRILQGKSRPGLDNAFRLAKAVGVSLDFLADDSLEMDFFSHHPTDTVSSEDRRILNLAQKIGGSEVLTILETVRFLGYEVAMSRLVGVGAKPIIEIDKEAPEHRATVSPAPVSVSVPARVNSATG
jgi:transcriptional regulator with XRE-family HTH domain